jgi:hypothetical protein
MVIYPFLGRIWCRRVFCIHIRACIYMYIVCVDTHTYIYTNLLTSDPILNPLTHAHNHPSKNTQKHSVCPFMVWGEWAQETLKKVVPDVKLRKWPQSITHGCVLCISTCLCIYIYTHRPDMTIHLHTYIHINFTKQVGPLVPLRPLRGDFVLGGGAFVFLFI